MRAADLFTKGVSQADIARQLEVSHQTVSDWHTVWLIGGSRLSNEQASLVVRGS